MSIIETTWKPTIASVEKKNNKYALAQTIIEIWHMSPSIKDEKSKVELGKILMRVL